MVTLSPPTALPLAGEIAVTCGSATAGDTGGAVVGKVGRGDMPRPDDDAGDAQGSGARVSPPTPLVEQLRALPPPPLEVADPLPAAPEVADPLPPAPEVVIVGLETV